MSKKRVVYRDYKTGKFVSKSTWKRSRAHGGTRYKRHRVRQVIPRKRPRLKKPAAVRPAAPPMEEYVIRIKSNATKREREEPAEIHIVGPSGASGEEVLQAIDSYATGEKIQLGFKFPKAINWRGKEYDAKDDRLKFAIANILTNPQIVPEK
jgi:hypothetical protein